MKTPVRKYHFNQFGQNEIFLVIAKAFNPCMYLEYAMCVLVFTCLLTYYVGAVHKLCRLGRGGETQPQRRFTTQNLLNKKDDKEREGGQKLPILRPHVYGRHLIVQTQFNKLILYLEKVNQCKWQSQYIKANTANATHIHHGR